MGKLNLYCLCHKLSIYLSKSHAVSSLKSQALDKSISIIQTKSDLCEVEREFVSPYKRLSTQTFKISFHILNQVIVNYSINFEIKSKTLICQFSLSLIFFTLFPVTCMCLEKLEYLRDSVLSFQYIFRVSLEKVQ